MLAKPLDVLACLAAQDENLAQSVVMLVSGACALLVGQQTADSRCSHRAAGLWRRARPHLKQLAASLETHGRKRRTPAATNRRASVEEARDRLAVRVDQGEWASILGPTMVNCSTGAEWNWCMQKSLLASAKRPELKVKLWPSAVFWGTYSVASARPLSKPRP